MRDLNCKKTNVSMLKLKDFVVKKNIVNIKGKFDIAFLDYVLSKNIVPVFNAVEQINGKLDIIEHEQFNTLYSFMNEDVGHNSIKDFTGHSQCIIEDIPIVLNVLKYTSVQDDINQFKFGR